jgi:CubicO group peptidase (beta-lactamase class C family)
MRIVQISLILTALTAASPPPARADPALPLRACLDARAARDEFSGAVLIAERGRILWQAGYGFADAERRIPITPATRFNIASMGKMFTAVAIGQLVDAGRLRFDDPISRHLPGLVPEIGAITVRQLLTHTSGLRDYFRPGNRAAIDGAETATDLLPIAIADGVAFAPGSSYAYSNSGFVVLGAIVERLTGASYADYVRRHIFAPARMTDTSLDGATPRAQAMTRMSPGGGRSEGPPHAAPMTGPARASPAGGATSSVGDLLRFAEALRRGRLVRPATRELMWQAQLVPPNQRDPAERASYGFGFNRIDVGARRWLGHGGGAPGSNAQLEIDPEAGRVAIALSNYDPPGATEAVRSARRAFMGASAEAICAAAPEPPAAARMPGR